MSSADRQYLQIVSDILDRGYYDQNRTGMPSYKLPHQIMQFQLDQGLPILTTKYVAFKTAVQEMLWIWQQQSNDVRWLQERGIRIWDAWAGHDGTIGKAYGYQIDKFQQLDDLLDRLRRDPQSRRMVVSLWNVADLPEMNLKPCAFLTMWDVTDGALNCMLVQRSGDMGLGIPFNTLQYAVLVHLVAKVTGLKPGLFTHVINNAHIYENHVAGLRLQLSRANEDYPAPRLVLNASVDDFYAFTIDDIRLDGYQHGGRIKMDISV